jgi:hypothetical protein
LPVTADLSAGLRLTYMSENPADGDFHDMQSLKPV